MEWNPETLEFLSQCFLHTLSPAPEPRRHAEASLSAAADSPNYGLAVLRLVAEPSVDEQIRIAAAVNFKNHLRARWAPASADDPNSPVFSFITDAEKEQIKALIVHLMLSSTPKIQSQLSEALALIGKHDFPKLWPALLPELVANLQKAAQASDYSSINGAIELKLTAVASARLICDSPVLLDTANVELWGKMLDSIVTLLSRPEQDRVEEEPEMPDIADNVGYTATFVRLYNAEKKEEDPLRDIKDPKEFLVASLARLSSLSPGRYPQIINQYMDPANQAALLQLCRTYNCPIV